MGVLEVAWKGLRSFRAKRTFESALMGEDVRFGPYAYCSDLSRISPSVRIGSHVYLDCSLFTRGAGRIVIGSNTWIGGAGSTALGAVRSVTIGSNTIVSNHVHIYDNNNHPTDPERRIAMTVSEHGGELWGWEESDASEVVIGDNVWIGEFAMILKGVSVGEGAVVGAHSVVTKDVPPYTIVAGNPARVVKRLR